jgi:UDP-glucose 4-epimerase
MKILVTGGYGYIGQNFIKEYSNEFKFYISELERGDLKPAEHIDNFDYFDGVVHLAALSGIVACEDNPRQAIRSNLFTAQNVFLGASKAMIPVVFTSSQAAKNPPSSSYAMQKRIAELMAEQLNSQGSEITVLRLTNVYGGLDYLTKKNTVIKKFITKYKKGLPLCIDGDGSQKRDFIHVEDVCRAIYHALKKPYTKGPIDIGTGYGTSIMEIASYLCKGKEYPIEFSDDRSAGVESSTASISEAAEHWCYTASPRMKEYINEEIKE